MKILNTRPRDQAADLTKLLTGSGYEVVEIPLVELVLLREELDSLAKIPPEDYDGVLLSSPNLLPLLDELRLKSNLQPLIAKPWYLISKRALPWVEALGAQVDFYPRMSSLGGFLREFRKQYPGKKLRLLHPCSQATRIAPDDFLRAGITVQNVSVYAPHCPANVKPALQKAWPELDAVLFASGSAVNNFFSAAPPLAKTLRNSGGPAVISIGPSSSEALTAHGVEEFRQADSADNAGLISALDSVFRKP